MLSNKRCYSLIFHLVVFSLLELFVLGTEVRLKPADVQVNIGNWATFNCSVSCELNKTHTVRWFVGSTSGRLVDLSTTNFYRRTGIQVEVRKPSGCEGSPEPGMALYQLRVNVTSESMELLNKASVQCAALRKAPNFSDLYSHYGVISVNEEQQTTIVPHTEDKASTSALPPIAPTQTVIVTKVVTMTVTATVSPTNVANPSAGSTQTLCNGAPRRISSQTLTMFVLCLTLLALFLHLT